MIDFDFNHNQIYDSTVEHAESRLVRRVFSLNQIYDPWFALEGDDVSAPTVGARRARRSRARRNVFATEGAEEPTAAPPKVEAAMAAQPAAPVPYSTLLSDVTIYTSLESCAQCSGIMCLGSVKDIVYLQWDQGQFLVGNIMWQATTTEKMGFTAPRPIRGDEFGFQYFGELNKANEEFEAKVPSAPFYEGGEGQKNNSPAVTSFLCTDQARRIYLKAAQELSGFTPKFPAFKPPKVEGALTNQEAITEARDFVDWVSQLQNRGAPHRV